MRATETHPITAILNANWRSSGDWALFIPKYVPTIAPAKPNIELTAAPIRISIPVFATNLILTGQENQVMRTQA